ncbi:hypothetical protein F66182_6069 [Fusarium sp. NRRL 66182]|nr:hypothetical protein F66182_6069 [Fusarium sp. NRRL 66182]
MHLGQFLALGIISTSQVAAQTPVQTPAPTDGFYGPDPPFDDACYKVITSAQAEMTGGSPGPDIDPALSELVVSFAIGGLHNTRDNCELPVVTGTSAEAFSEWASWWTSQQSSHLSQYRDIWSACSDEPLVTDIVPVGTDVCSDFVAKITGAPTSAAKDEESQSRKGQGEDEAEEEGGDENEPVVVEESAGARSMGSPFAAFVAMGIMIAGLY